MSLLYLCFSWLSHQPKSFLPCAILARLCRSLPLFSWRTLFHVGVAWPSAHCIQMSSNCIQWIEAGTRLPSGRHHDPKRRRVFYFICISMPGCLVARQPWIMQIQTPHSGINKYRCKQSLQIRKWLKSELKSEWEPMNQRKVQQEISLKNVRQHKNKD